MNQEIDKEMDRNDAQYLAFEKVIIGARNTLGRLRAMSSPDSRGYVDWRIAQEHLVDLTESASESLENRGAYNQLTRTLVRSILFFDRDCRRTYFGENENGR